MKFSKSYEPGEYEADIYAAWEASGIFNPKLATKPTDNNSDGIDDRTRNIEKTYSIVMPPPNANGNLHIGHGLIIALEDSLTRYHRLKGDSTWYIPGADHAGFETWVVYERELERKATLVLNMIAMNSTLEFGILSPTNVAIWSYNSVLLAHLVLGTTLLLLLMKT